MGDNQITSAKSVSGTAKEIDKRKLYGEFSKQVVVRFLKKLGRLIRIREKYGILKRNRFTKLRWKTK